MSRVLLIGRGPLPSPEQSSGGFSSLRTRHFLAALRAAGHEVRLLLLLRGARSVPTPEQWAGCIEIEEEGPGWLEACRDLGRSAEVVVSAGPLDLSWAKRHSMLKPPSL